MPRPWGFGNNGTKSLVKLSPSTLAVSCRLFLVNGRIAQGVDVRGFFHWTGVDNYEWLHGYDVKFGIVDRDRNVRPSADVLRREALGST